MGGRERERGQYGGREGAKAREVTNIPRVKCILWEFPALV